MLLLLLCIMCNVVLAVIFKYFDKFKVDNLQAIVVNYIVCVLFASALMGESAIPLDLFATDWWPYSLTLSFLFIVGFNIMALSFQKSGVALTAIIQKMSLIIPASVAIAVYGEPLQWAKGLGIVLALIAIVLVNIPSKGSDSKFSIFQPLIVYPLITFLLSGIIEVILYYVEVEGIVGDDGAKFTATAFGMAATLGFLFAAFRAIKDAQYPGIKELIGGVTLGLPNYLSIYLLVVLLSQGWEGSRLFPLNSIAILIMTALIGFIFYKEQPDKMKVTGILLGVGAIVLLSFF